jgi:hypothetical protein
MARSGSLNQLAKKAGVTYEAVRKAAENGRIHAIKSGRNWKIPDLATALLQFNDIPEDDTTDERPDKSDLDPLHANSLPDSYDGSDIEDSAAVEKFWKAKTAEQNYRKASGELVERVEAQAAFDNAAATAKHKILEVPSQIQQRLMLPLEHLELIKSMLKEALESLSQG